MKIREVITELKKKPREPQVGDTTPHDYNPGWERLNYFKQEGLKLGQNIRAPQLFIPRPHPGAKTNRDRRMDNLANKWAWDEKDPTKLKPQYARLQGDDPDEEVTEAAPILFPGKSPTPAGNNKPYQTFWTSSAKKLSDGSWTSEWANYIANNGNKDWRSPKGYLYKIKPGAVILSIDSDHDAEDVKQIFNDLAGITPKYDTENPYNNSISKNFPWDQVAKHFDAVHHFDHYRHGSEFVYGWDCESTAWFNTDMLQLIGEVDVGYYGFDDEDY
jgi:hypothetical protein